MKHGAGSKEIYRSGRIAVQAVGDIDLQRVHEAADVTRTSVKHKILGQNRHAGKRSADASGKRVEHGGASCEDAAEHQVPTLDIDKDRASRGGRRERRAFID